MFKKVLMDMIVGLYFIVILKKASSAHKLLDALKINAQFCVNDDTKLCKDTKLRPVLILCQ